VRWLVVGAEPITSVDVTSADVLDELDATLHKAGIDLCFAEMKDPVKDKLKRFGLFSRLGEERFFAADPAPAEVVARRREGFRRLAGLFAERHPKSIAQSATAGERISDMQFTRAYRVPFQFSAYFRQHLKLGSFVTASEGVTVTDLDGQRFYDLTGSYGVNVLGYDFYKSCMEEAAGRVKDLGPVLGSYHPLVAWNAER
jgi:glutamate-1-semialdehyde 2,1-aminomutase